MSDLRNVNERIIKRFELSPVVGKNVDIIPVCLGKLSATLAEMSVAVSTPKAGVDDLEDFILNKEYLTYARVVCQGIRFGEFESLVILSVNYEMAVYLASLTNFEVTAIARNWDGPILRCSTLTHVAARMNDKNALVYAASLLAA